MINYQRILQTGIQSLLAVGCGWGCGRWQVVPEPEATVAYTNTLVLRFCIPCLQVWLLAVKTDMQQGDNWRALAAFLVWSLGLQALLAAHQLVTRQRLQLDRLGVGGLILTTNNTGILGPVVLEAAVGAQYAPLGMLATVVLYFQQLPLAQLLFQLHHNNNTTTQQQQQQLLLHMDVASAGGDSGVNTAGSSSSSSSRKFITSPQPSYEFGDDASLAQQPPPSHGGGGGDGSSRHGHQQLRHKQHHTAHAHDAGGGGGGGGIGAAAGAELVSLQHSQQARLNGSNTTNSSLTTIKTNSIASQKQQQQQHGFGSAGALSAHKRQGHGRHLSWDVEQQQQGGSARVDAAATAAAGNDDDDGGDGGGGDGRPLLGGASMGPSQHPSQQLEQAGAASYVVSLLLKNPLVWSTAIAVLLSALGSAALLDPSSPLALKHLAFLEALLGWFAQTTAPLTLFTTGLWMYSNQQQQRQQEQQRQQRQPAPHSNGLVGDHHSSVSASAPSFGSRDVAWGDVATQLLLRATVAPLWMVVVCRAMGFRGDLGHALVILALLPVAQTAFVVCKQAETGMAAVSTMLVASLFAMLPQLMIVLALLERLGVLAPTDV